ncbi:MAG: glycogen synthase, partial [Flavobacteriaceae bacterium]
PFEEPLSSNLIKKLAFDGLDGELTKGLKTPNFSALAKNAIANSDGLIIADTDIDKSVKKEILSSNKPILHSSSKEGFEEDYNEFYTNQILKLEK